jgi:hypothetical protein
MTWRIIRKTPARGDKPARDIGAGCNIFDRETAEEIAAKLEGWAADFDGAKFIVEEEEKKSE